MSELYLPDSMLLAAEKPGRYIGGELNSVTKAPGEYDVHMAMCFADVYDIGMSHLGFKLLYHLLNDQPGVWCERVFAPWPDLEDMMRAKGYKLFTLESQTEAAGLDMLAFSLQYEMSYTNVLNMLDLAGIPVRASERSESDPLIFCGGPSANNTEPMAEFFDFYNLGEGEEMLPEIMETYRACKREGLPKVETLKKLARIEGVYVPSFYDCEYDESGRFLSLRPKAEYADVAPARIRKRIVSSFENANLPEKMVVPNTEVVHDRIMLEIFRGCTRGCRFCQAGFIYRPVRERSPERLVEAARKLLASTGYEEISMLSLSTSDYSRLGELTDKLLEITVPQRVSIALPSLRLDSFSFELMEKVSAVRKSGLTFAPEAGTQRLRDIINKGVNEEDLLRSCRIAFEGGWSTVKLYFMLGLPFETDDDLIGIAELAHKVLAVYDDVHAGRKARRPSITVSVSTFVPKPFTPFQWAPQIPVPEIRRRQDVIKQHLSRRVSFSWHDPETSVLEGAISRGDRRIGDVIYSAWKAGARFDAWQEYLDYGRWMDAFTANGLHAEDFNRRERETDEALPWDHVDVGVTKRFLQRELERAKQGVVTPNCASKCAGCGVQSYGRGICVGKIQDQIQ
ncbi:MAG: TIGR03960 family B12-binding radical SAM protein [Clostridia bacterium]|nr:TIGR03960 family B12-binding radical SAM protein [Clostridia bacterium]